MKIKKEGYIMGEWNTMYFKVHLHYVCKTEKDRPTTIEQLWLHRNFVKYRNKYVDVFNKGIDQWNKDFDIFYHGPEIEDYSENAAYGEWIAKCANMAFRIVEEQNKWSTPLIDIEVDNGQITGCSGDIIGRFKKKDCVVYMTMEQV